MDFSYWEFKTYLANIDFTVIGSGIVGLSCALHLKEKYPTSKILILEKGILPQGASTKNAGFACFGSISELLADMRNTSPELMKSLVEKRYSGLQLLRETLGDKAIGYQQHGGHELFLESQHDSFVDCSSNVRALNSILKPIFKADCFSEKANVFGFNGIQSKYISSPFEAQINTGFLMQNLLQKVQGLGIQILNTIEVTGFEDAGNKVTINTANFNLETRKLCICTNGFASQLGVQSVLPARAQVLITKPIKDLKIRGTFHLDEGYYYFRNIDDRILLGGGRNLDFKTEETHQFGLTDTIQNRLDEILRTIILPNTKYAVERRWSGIMGVGDTKQPIIRAISANVYCGVKMGGMGIAIGSSTGKELAGIV